MTQKSNNYREIPFETRELWRALLVIYKHFEFFEALLDPNIWEGTDWELTPEVVDAIRMLDACLEIASQVGWLETVQQ